jgi:hypothetical protein
VTKSKPVVCTLTARERGERAERWRDVFATAGAVINRLPGGVAVRLPCDAAAKAEIEELVELERACCEWMTLAVQGDSYGVVTVTMTAESDEGEELISQFVQPGRKKIKPD